MFGMGDLAALDGYGSDPAATADQQPFTPNAALQAMGKDPNFTLGQTPIYSMGQAPAMRPPAASAVQMAAPMAHAMPVRQVMQRRAR